MAPACDSDTVSLPLSAELRIHERCCAFEAAWTEARSAGTAPPEIASFLDSFDVAEQPALANELVLLDVSFRRGSGERLTRDAYRKKLAGYPHVLDVVDRAVEPVGPNVDLAQRRNLESARGEGPATSLSLLDRVRSRDQDACTSLVELYAPLVYFWARRAGLSQEDSADVVQEVFRSVFDHIGQFRKEQPGDTFRGWLWTISRNKLRDHFRRRERQAAAIGGSDATRFWHEIPEAEPTDSGQAAALTSRRQQLDAALNRIRGDFSAETWNAFWLAAFEDRTSPEIAAQLGITANAARHAKARVLRRLREELRDLVE